MDIHRLGREVSATFEYACKATAALAPILNRAPVPYRIPITTAVDFRERLESLTAAADGISRPTGEEPITEMVRSLRARHDAYSQTHPVPEAQAPPEAETDDQDHGLVGIRRVVGGVEVTTEALTFFIPAAPPPAHDTNTCATPAEPQTVRAPDDLIILDVVFLTGIRVWHIVAKDDRSRQWAWSLDCIPDDEIKAGRTVRKGQVLGIRRPGTLHRTVDPRHASLTA